MVYVVQHCDPYLASDTVLGDLSTQMVNLRNHVDLYLTNDRDLSLLENGMPYVNAASQQASMLPISVLPSEAAQEVTSLRRSIGQHRAQVEREIQETVNAGEQARLEFTKQVAEAQEAVGTVRPSIDELRAELDQMQALVRDATNQQQNAFAEAQTSRTQAFDSLLEEKRAETSAVVTELREKTNAEIAGSEERVKGELEQVTADKARVEEILGIVSEEALIGTYSKNATEDKRFAFWWSVTAIVFAITTVVIAGVLVHTTRHGGSDWDAFSAKFIFLASAGGLAAYAGRQSTEHRHAQRTAEHMALQLAALKPYLNDLDNNDQRDELLAEIAKRLFGQPFPTRKSGDSVSADNPGLIPQAVALALEIQKATK